MLDALFGAGKGQPPAAAELQALIETAREERAALGEMLTQVTHRSAKLSQTGKSIEQVDKTATGAIERVESVAGRLANLDDRVKGLEEIDTRMQQFLDTVTSARQDIENLVGSGSELQKHRDEVQQLSQRALETRWRCSPGTVRLRSSSGRHYRKPRTICSNQCYHCNP